MQEQNGKHSLKIKEREIARIPIDAIRPNPYQPRRIFSNEALEELSASIRQYGLLQPISVRKVENGKYELIAGERRLRASKMAGLKEIDAIVFSSYEQDSAVVAMMENLQRENLHYFEEAEGYLNLIHDHGLSQDELARRLGKNQSTIANKMRILKLPVKVKRLLIQYNLSERHARALLRLHDEDMQMKVLSSIIHQGMNVKATEELVERILNRMYGIEEEEKPEEPKTRNFVRDNRIYLNSIQSVIRQMKEAGLAAEISTVETEEGLEIHLSIPKNGSLVS